MIILKVDYRSLFIRNKAEQNKKFELTNVLSMILSMK